MTEKIVEHMEERRQQKNKNESNYREIHKKIQKKLKEAKEIWLQSECQEIDNLQEKHDVFNLHRKIKEAAGLRKQQHTGVIEDTENNLIIDQDKRINRWTEFRAEQFGNEQEMDSVTRGITVPEITRTEVRGTIQRLKNNKAPETDQVYGETLKLLEEDQINLLIALFNKVYETGYIPKEHLFLSHEKDYQKMC